MIEILHKTTGVVLYKTDAVTLENKIFPADKLNGADFHNHKLNGARFMTAMLNDSDFTGASCIGINFYSMHLQRANLSNARLWAMRAEGTDFRNAILNGAKMEGAWLWHAAMSEADLQNADLTSAYLASATLQKSDLRSADLTRTFFHRTELQGTLLAGATLCSTVFADCTSLHKAEGLSELIHLGPSSIDHLTLRACAAHLPDVFLLGISYTEDELRQLRLMYPALEVVPRKRT